GAVLPPVLRGEPEADQARDRVEIQRHAVEGLARGGAAGRGGIRGADANEVEPAEAELDSRGARLLLALLPARLAGPPLPRAPPRRGGPPGARGGGPRGPPRGRAR